MFLKNGSLITVSMDASMCVVAVYLSLQTSLGGVSRLRVVFVPPISYAVIDSTMKGGLRGETNCFYIFPPPHSETKS